MFNYGPEHRNAAHNFSISVRHFFGSLNAESQKFVKLMIRELTQVYCLCEAQLPVLQPSKLENDVAILVLVVAESNLGQTHIPKPDVIA